MKRVLLSVFSIFFMIFSLSVEVKAEGEKVLKVVSPWKVKGLDLHKSGFMFARMGCIEMLTTADDKGRITGLLAESWQVSDNKKTWNFQLKKGIRFHDGTPLTAGAAAKSLRISLENKGVISRAKVTDIIPADRLNLRIKTAEPFSALPAYLAHYSAGIVSTNSFDKSNAVTDVYGTGQYIHTGQNGDSLFSFKASPDFRGKVSDIKYTEYHAVSKGETRGFMVKAGQADMAFNLSPADAKLIQSSGKAKVKILTIPRTRLIMLNCRMPEFNDASVRKAISLAIDRKGIATGLLKNPDSAASQLLPPSSAVWHNPELPHLSYDPDQAKRLLAEAGWEKGADGILVKDGQPFEFEMITYASRPMLPAVATAIQQQLEQVGIKLFVKVAEASQIPAQRSEGTLEAALLARNFGQIPDPIGTIYGDYGPEPGSWGAMGWESKELNHLLNGYLNTFNKPEAGDLKYEILNILQKELPVIPVTWYEHIVGISHRIENVTIDPFEIKSYVKGVNWTR